MFADSCLFGEEDAQHIGAVAGYAACMATMHKCGLFQKVDGVMLHTLCMPSDTCSETAQRTRLFWPECEAMLASGSKDGSCTKERAQLFWNEAVQELCKPFGSDDYPS